MIDWLRNDIEKKKEKVSKLESDNTKTGESTGGEKNREIAKSKMRNKERENTESPVQQVLEKDKLVTKTEKLAEIFGETKKQKHEREKIEEMKREKLKNQGEGK